MRSSPLTALQPSCTVTCTMSLKLSISEARARLPELAHRVMDAPGEVVIIEHRDRKERLVLTTESHYRAMEAAVQEGKKKQGKPPFRLLPNAISPKAFNDAALVSVTGSL